MSGFLIGPVWGCLVPAKIDHSGTVHVRYSDGDFIWI
jgi:hypothetical protein